MLSPFPQLQKFLLLALFGAAALIKFVHWHGYLSSLGLPFRIPLLFWEYAALLSLLAWNPKGIRVVLLAVLGFLVFELILSNFFVGGMSNLPYWYLFRDVYSGLHFDSLFAFLVESVLLLLLLLSIFPFKKPQGRKELLDDW